jgi:hypothetical protein
VSSAATPLVGKSRVGSTEKAEISPWEYLPTIRVEVFDSIRKMDP